MFTESIKSHSTRNPEGFKWKENTLSLISLAICVASLISALHPTIRGFIRSYFVKEYREVLSIATGAIEAGKTFKVIKIKTSKGLFIEVYGDSPNQIRPLLDRIKLPDNKDGYFMIKGQATNLALKDIDGDNSMEIIVPTYDSNLVAHLNVYKYDPFSRRFIQMSK